MIKKTRHSIYVILFTYVTVLNVSAQDPQFTQFYANKLYLAPSFAGATKQNRVALIYRNQWAGIPGAFNTMAFSYDHYFPTFNSGLGITAVRDVAGTGHLGMTQFGLAYSYDFQIKDNFHVRPGLNIQYSLYGIDFARLTFIDQLLSGSSTTMESPPTDNNIGALDGATSVLVYSSKFWSGLCVDHLFRPNESFYSNYAIVPVRYSFFGGVQVVRNGKLLKPIDESLSIAYMYRQQGDKKQLDLGLYWYKSPIVMGFWYRGIPGLNSERGDAVAVLLGYKTSKFSIGYSYDFTISNLINSTHGSHEISLVYEFNTTHRKKIHAIPCPEF